MGSDSSRYWLHSQIWSTAIYLNPPSLWVTINPCNLHDLIAQIFAGKQIDLDNFSLQLVPAKINILRISWQIRTQQQQPNFFTLWSRPYCVHYSRLKQLVFKSRVEWVLLGMLQLTLAWWRPPLASTALEDVTLAHRFSQTPQESEESSGVCEEYSTQTFITPYKLFKEFSVQSSYRVCEVSQAGALT